MKLWWKELIFHQMIRKEEIVQIEILEWGTFQTNMS